MANCWPHHAGQKRFEDEVTKKKKKNRKKKPKKKKKELKKRIGIEKFLKFVIFIPFINNHLIF